MGCSFLPLHSSAYWVSVVLLRVPGIISDSRGSRKRDLLLALPCPTPNLSSKLGCKYLWHCKSTAQPIF